MTEQTSVLTDLQDTELERKRTIYRKRIRTGQVASVILSLMLLTFAYSLLRGHGREAIIPSVIFTAFLLLSIAGFKWTYACLATYSILFSTFLAGFIAFMVLYLPPPENNFTLIGVVLIFITVAIPDILMIRGTIAAKKHRKLSKQKER